MLPLTLTDMSHRRHTFWSLTMKLSILGVLFLRYCPSQFSFQWELLQGLLYSRLKTVQALNIVRTWLWQVYWRCLGLSPKAELGTYFPMLVGENVTAKRLSSGPYSKAQMQCCTNAVYLITSENFWEVWQFLLKIMDMFIQLSNVSKASKKNWT